MRQQKVHKLLNIFSFCLLMTKKKDCGLHHQNKESIGCWINTEVFDTFWAMRVKERELKIMGGVCGNAYYTSSLIYFENTFFITL